MIVVLIRKVALSFVMSFLPVSLNAGALPSGNKAHILNGRSINLGHKPNLNGRMIKVNGGPLPHPFSYQKGKILVDHKVYGITGSGNERYRISLFNKTGKLIGHYLMPAKTINSLLFESHFSDIDKKLKSINQSNNNASNCPEKLDLNLSPISAPSTTLNDNKPTVRRGQGHRFLTRRRPNKVSSPRASHNSGSSTCNSQQQRKGICSKENKNSINKNTNSRTITFRENDNAEKTKECEVLRANDTSANEWSRENLLKCIRAIQEKILQGVPQPLSENTKNLASLRMQILKRLFELPNEEQEFAAAIFTLDGEIGGHAKENPMEAIMILKVMTNRRDNANEIENEVKNCKMNNSDQKSLGDCIKKANINAQYNLLDIALDKLQFSMYNSPSRKGNWYNKFGTKRPSQFEDSINAFFLMDETIDWQTSSTDDFDVNKVYHYHTRKAMPDWRRDNLMLSIGAKHPEIGNLQPTHLHVFYEEHDQKANGNSGGDGWKRKVRHEFRDFND